MYIHQYIICEKLYEFTRHTCSAQTPKFIKLPEKVFSIRHAHFVKDTVRSFNAEKF